MAETVTLQLPSHLHQRLVNTAQATRQPLESVILRAITVGSPPDWADVPAEFQPELAALDRLEDEALWQIARACQPKSETSRYDELLEFNQSRPLSAAEQLELLNFRTAADGFMLRKAHAASILQWRGHRVPMA